MKEGYFMKRLIALAIAMILCVGLFASCSTEDGQVEETTTDAETTTAPETTAELSQDPVVHMLCRALPVWDLQS